MSEIDENTTNPLRIRELNHIAINVRDLHVSVKFYGEVLGLPLLSRPAFNFPGAWFSLGTQELHLIEDQAHVPDERRPTHFALLVDSSAAAHAELHRRGVTGMRGPAPRPDGAVQTYLQDPDGYLIEIVSPADGMK